MHGYDYVTEKYPTGQNYTQTIIQQDIFVLITFSLTRGAGLPYYKSNMLRSMDWSPQDDQYVIFRKSKFEDWSILFQDTGGEGRVNYVSNEESKWEVEHFHNVNNLLYNNNHILISNSHL